jgi:hypothetical protein
VLRRQPSRRSFPSPSAKPRRCRGAQPPPPTRLPTEPPRRDRAFRVRTRSSTQQTPRLHLTSKGKALRSVSDSAERASPRAQVLIALRRAKTRACRWPGCACTLGRQRSDPRHRARGLRRVLTYARRTIEAEAPTTANQVVTAHVTSDGRATSTRALVPRGYHSGLLVIAGSGPSSSVAEGLPAPHSTAQGDARKAARLINKPRPSRP